MSTILIIDDQKPIRNALREILEFEKYTIEEAADGFVGLEMIGNKNYDLVFCDIKMPRLDGLEFLKKVTEKENTIPIIMISGHGDIETAVQTLKLGAYDYIEKPLDLNRVLKSVKNAFEKNFLKKENNFLKRKIKKITNSEIIGESEEINIIKDLILKVAKTDARILITGSNGTGKELVAQQVHENSDRRKKPFIEVNCAAIPSELIESELFGHEKGSFTSAYKQKIGKFEQASDGTLFLDEIGDMSLSAQAKVLRALQENKITRVGGNKSINVNPRIIAATNKTLKKEIENGNFREDLFHRLNVIPIHVPSLDDRKDDIPLLCKHFLSRISHEQGLPKKEISEKAILELQKIQWSGNIRELKNIIERLVILSDDIIGLKEVKKYVVTPT
ncbi:MAG: sigma-54 dependent transcriptional regulator [Flavobacteriales bacterium]|nr:sigma-54 dependent transcriptional regulator [Flavobacteriales bacterium]MDG1439147.1 sigma-54 dependent transcriptional regulator [Flavobacteriales bacterium]MDG1798229.1 sigma-54 dependent transcriptional regulator [Flavobacteriales bacterium]